MTQQSLAVLTPQTSRHAVPAPGSEGLSRPKRAPGKVVPLIVHENLRKQRKYTTHEPPQKSEYPGLVGRGMAIAGKYSDAVRVRVAGGEARLLMANELEEWHARISAIIAKRSDGPLDKKPR